MSISDTTIKKITFRLVPYLCLLYFVAFLDRVNVGFAAIHMNTDLGLSATAFGMGAGMFFIGYFIFEVPSNIALQKFGARSTISRIMILWGIISCGFAFVKTDTQFYVLRFLLGAAEAGFLPGIIYYLTLWLPSQYRARVMALFLMMIPASSVVGAPLSTWIMSVMAKVNGLQGWQWMFIIEAVPAIILGVSVIRYLPNRPSEVTWLSTEEKQWLDAKLIAEDKVKATHLPTGILNALLNLRTVKIIVLFSSISFGIYGVGFWIAQIIKSFGNSLEVTGLITAIPYLLASVAMVWWGRRSDKTQERTWHVVLPLWFGSAAFVLAFFFLNNPVVATIALSLCLIGIFSALPPYMTYPTIFFSGGTVAVGIAAINSIGNLAGYFGPTLVGVLKDLTGSFGAGMLLIGAVLFIGGLAAFSLRKDFYLEKLASENSSR